MKPDTREALDKPRLELEELFEHAPLFWVSPERREPTEDEVEQSREISGHDEDIVG